MSLATPSSVQKLQKALHDKAKESPSYRFYALYDKVYRKDVLACVYDRCHANRGAAGVDGQEFEDIEKYGVERWLDELAEELKSRTYQPQPLRRVMIDKPGGGKRPLGIPEQLGGASFVESLIGGNAVRTLHRSFYMRVGFNLILPSIMLTSPVHNSQLPPNDLRVVSPWLPAHHESADKETADHEEQ